MFTESELKELYRQKYSLVELTKKGLIEVIRLRTIEEAYDMLRKYMDYKKDSKFEIIEVCT